MRREILALHHPTPNKATFALKELLLGHREHLFIPHVLTLDWQHPEDEEIIPFSQQLLGNARTSMCQWLERSYEEPCSLFILVLPSLLALKYPLASKCVGGGCGGI